MEIIRVKHPLTLLADYVKPCVMALGFFDGVHLGHRQVLDTARKIAKRKGLHFSVMTFFPHPKEVMSKGKLSVNYLMPLSVKEEQFKCCGVETLYVVEFEPHFAKLSPEAFVQQYLVNLEVKHVVAGFDFTYGSAGKGTMKTMKEHGCHAFDVTTVSKVELKHEKISSTLIRQLILSGNVHMLPNYLGGYYESEYEIEGIKDLTTLKQLFLKVKSSYTTPKSGVYVVTVTFEQKEYDAVCHVLPEENEVELFVYHCPKIIGSKYIKVKWIKEWIIKPVNESTLIADEAMEAHI